MQIVRRKSNLIPYRFTQNHFEFYLSHRSENAKQFPNLWSFWGGGIEDKENPEEAMIREIYEELNWKSDQCEFLGVYYDSVPNEKHIYFTKVSQDFEKEINICEGQGGRFFTIDEIAESLNIISGDKKPLLDLLKILKDRLI